MNIMTLNLISGRVHYHFFPSGHVESQWSGCMENAHGFEDWRIGLAKLRQRTQNSGHTTDAIGVRLLYGGSTFHNPWRVTAETESELQALSAEAPLHVPAAIEFIRAIRETYYNVPLFLLFETAFFTDMPERECRYALDVNSLGMPNLRRYGYHGLFHEAACACARDFSYKEGSFFSERCLSICLETQPEIVAVDGFHPVMVSSGATPLEGLPGQTNSGELDAGIVMMLVQKKKWGPEQINHALTLKSGLSGIAGRPVQLDEVLESDDPSLRLARDVFRHRLLLACGSGVAVLGGLDAIIFSGRYASSAHCLGPWLREHLKRAYQGRSELVIHEHILNHSIDRILADQIRWRPLLDIGLGKK
ncbi:hypothetical protein DO021_15860 [Desulfobacter hydrogenophilus]|uniref:Uncharacterized protein n=1 Tax=Desulfobacter hydrogenophilus TaxID=2291 RepID=A0A328FD79_9BACT|nr:acetate/propionate family kinase [Desulfobacter hydrogenophilus]NDY72919.1 hypothetical protein [Desulfobacter hydrogenophilus]QBH11833.1 hypothetical protein EYB58_02150 [Desulfobacter hydrogenophilus]RAM01063.1 hypothetical protein DO021_15860 [Desulfobacter hydrogenophilus]